MPIYPEITHSESRRATKYNPGLVDHAHNDYLEVLAESGIIGVGALLIHSFFDFNLRIPANAAYFVALFAFAARAVEIKNQET